MKESERRTYISKCVEDIRKVRTGLLRKMMLSNCVCACVCVCVARVCGWCLVSSSCIDLPRVSTRPTTARRTRSVPYHTLFGSQW